MDSETIKYVLNVFIMVVIIFCLITMIDIIRSHYKKEAPHEKKLLAVVTMEGFNNNNNKPNLDVNININMKKGDSFCKHNMGSSSLNESCGNLTQRNCNSTSCCVWLSDEKCAAGGKGGPTFNTDDNGKTKDIDYYYYQNKCYGKKCPT